MKIMQFLAFSLGVIACTTASAVVTTKNKTSGGWWVTIYDIAKNRQYDYGCVAPNGERKWTNAIYKVVADGRTLVMRAELTPDAQCKQPKVCDTDMRVTGEETVELLTATDSYGKPVLSKCWLRAGAVTHEESTNTKKMDWKNLEECRKRTIGAYATVESLLQRAKDAPKPLTDGVRNEMKAFQPVLKNQIEYTNVSQFMAQCPAIAPKLSFMAQSLRPYAK